MYLVTAWEMKEMDRDTIGSFGIPGQVLMENAGPGAAGMLIDKIAELKQVVGPPRPVPLPVVDLGGLVSVVREPTLYRLLVEEARRPFDLAGDLMLRARLFRLSRADHALSLTVHHIASDGWSQRILLRELGALYAACRRGEEPALPPLAIQYADFAAWQGDRLGPGRLAEPLRYWRERLADAPMALDLPSDRPRPAVPSGRGARRARLLPPDLTAGVRALARLGTPRRSWSGSRR